MHQRIQELDDRTVLRLLSAVTQNLREQLTTKEATLLGTADDARAAMAALIESQTGQKVEASSIAFDGPKAAGAARQILAILWEDPQTRPAVDPELVNPPSDSQKSPELALAGAVILGALVSWLQTKVEFEMNRGKDGKYQFRFSAKKGAAGEGIIRNTVQTVTHLIGL